MYVPTRYHAVFNKILREHRSDYHMTTILRRIVSLNADPLQGSRLNPAGDICETRSGHITMQYSLHNGAVLIDYLGIGTPSVDQRFGLFPVFWVERNRRWAPAKEAVDTIDKDHQWRSKAGKAHYAAVAGRFDDKESAGHLLSEHVIGAYQKADYLTSTDSRGPFSMYWIRKGQHKSPEAAQALASIMQQCSETKRAVNWLVHDAAADTFKAAEKILSTQPLADTKTRALDKKAGTVQDQNVYFSNPNTSSTQALEKLCKEAGLNYVGMNSNNRDLRRASTLKNLGAELGKSLVVGTATAGTASGATAALDMLGADKVENVINNGLDALVNGNYFAAAIAVVAGGVIAIGVKKRVKPIAATMYCTFGKGNQKGMPATRHCLDEVKTGAARCGRVRDSFPVIDAQPWLQSRATGSRNQ